MLAGVAVQNSSFNQNVGAYWVDSLDLTGFGRFVKSTDLTDVILSALNYLLTLPPCDTLCLGFHNIYGLSHKTQ
jgi:hypothetical protein